MEEEFSIEKQDFNIVKEKIIKTNEILLLYNEKNEKLAKATQAFRQLKSKYETAMNETNRLKIDNERLNYSLETIRPKHEQNEKDLIELRADYTRVDERYQQNMIESQLTISELEEKVKHCTCEKDLCLSPSKRLTANERVKELKEICKELRKVENKLKNENSHLLGKNNELKNEQLKKIKLLDDLADKNVNLQKELIEVKNKVQNMECISTDQANLELTINSLKKNHEKEIHSLKMEISKLSRDNQRIRYLELECEKLKDQINSYRILKTEKSDCYVQTEEILENNNSGSNDSMNLEKINILEHKCSKLKKKIAYFENNVVSKQDIGIQVEIVVPNDDFSDFDDSVSDIFNEMILPKALSPMSCSSRSTESPIPPPFLSSFEALTPMSQIEEVLSQPEPFASKPIPNIVITPPTPSIEKGSNPSIFKLSTENFEKDKPLREESMDEVNSVIEDTEHKKDTNEKVMPVSEIQLSKMDNLSSNEVMDSTDEKSISAVENTDTDKSSAPLTETPISVSQNAENMNEGAAEKINVFKHPAKACMNLMPGLEASARHDTQKLGQELSDQNKVFTRNINSNSTEPNENINDKHKLDEFKHPENNYDSMMLQLEAVNAVDTQELPDKNTFSSKKAELSTNNVNSDSIEPNENIKGEHDLEKQLVSEHKDLSSACENLVYTCEKSVSTEDLCLLNTQWVPANENKTAKVNLQKDSLTLIEKPQRRRSKFWIPYNINTFVKHKNKLNQKRIAKVKKTYKEFSSNQSVHSDTILDALKTLQQHNINFTISNESIPLVQSYGPYSMISPLKTEPKSFSKKFKNTFSSSLTCWNKKCTEKNTQMLLRNVKNEEEPELLGFFNVKDEVVTPAASRMAVLKEPKQLDVQDLVAQLLSGIKELVDKQQEPSGSRRKRRSKSKTRCSDFYSETETELEQLFSQTGDVLGRNRRFLAAAKEQSFESNEESMFESESDLMVDSGLVTATPKIDTDSLGFCSQNDQGQSVGPHKVKPIIKNGKGTAKDNVLPNHDNDKKFIGLSLPSSSNSTIIKSPDILKNKTQCVSSNCTTPKFSECPAMLSPIASSKGSPESSQVASTPLNTPKSNTNSESSYNCFKLPFCPIMISPMSSTKGSPCNQISKATNIKYIGEDSLDSFRMASPLASVIKTSAGNSPKELKITDNVFTTRETDRSTNIAQTVSIDVNISEMLTEHQIKDLTEDSNNINPLYSVNGKSPVCQKITFDSVANSEQLYREDILKNPHELVSRTSINSNLMSLEKTVSNKDDTALSVTNIIPQSFTEATDSIDFEKNTPTQATLNKLESANTTEESSLNIDLSIKSSDLNCSLNDISISRLEVSSAVPHGSLKESNEVSATDILLTKSNWLDSRQLYESLNNKLHSEDDNSSNVEKRYSLRRKSRCNMKEDDPNRVVSLVTESTVDFASPRTRALKRKLEDKQKGDAEPENLAEPVKKKRGRPRKVDKVTDISESKELLANKIVDRSPVKKSIQEEVESHTEKISNIQEIINRSLFDSRPENEGISSLHNDISKQGSNRLCKVESETDSKIYVENSEEKIEDATKEDKTEIIFTTGVTKQIDCDNNFQRTLQKESQKCRRLRKIISKEFISESESECDISKNRLEDNDKAYKEVNDDRVNDQSIFCERIQSNSKINSFKKELFQKNILIAEQEPPSSNNVNCRDLVAGETDLNALHEAKNKPKNKIITSFDSESNSSVKSSCSSLQATTSEIQSMLRNLVEETAQTGNTFFLNGVSKCLKDVKAATTVSPDISCPSEKDLFGDVSESEEELCCSNNELTEKIIPKKASPRKVHKLKRKMMNQIRGMVYAYGKNKDCDNSKRSCENKPVEILRDSIPEKKSSNDLRLLDKEKKHQRIKIVQDILISKGQTFNLLSKSGKSEKPVSVSSSLRATEHIKSPPHIVNEKKAIRTFTRKRIRLEQNTSSSSTPVDILSQVMQGMVKTGPKTNARSNGANHSNYSSPYQGRQPTFNHAGTLNSGIEPKITQDTIRKPWRVEKTLAEEKTEEVVKDVDEFLDCPKSPDVMEVPDRLPRLIPTEKPVKLQGSKVRALIDKLMVFSNETKMLDDVIREFAFQDMTFMTEIIIGKLSQDFYDKADNLFPPSPPMTTTQRVLLGFILKLDKSTHPGIRDKFLSLAELQLYNKYTCKLEIVQPITRVYTALCKLRYDVNRIRRFICEGFYFMRDFAIPMLFTILTMWPEVLPMESESSDNLLAKVVIQICYLKECNQPGYNLLPLRDLLNKFFGYPTERWNCEDIFMEIMVDYIRNPSVRRSDFTLLLFLKNKPTKWVYQKMKEIIIPLYNQASDSNPNLKATLVILLVNIVCGFQKYEEYDWSVILEMDRWFVSLDIDDLDPIIKRSIHLARGRIPKRLRIRHKNKTAENGNTESSTLENKDNLDKSEQNCERMQSCESDLELIDTYKGGNCENSHKTNSEDTTRSSRKEYSESTNTIIVNIDSSLNHSPQKTCKNQIENFDISLSNDKGSDSTSSSISDIEF